MPNQPDDDNDFIELRPEMWANGAAPDSPIDCWYCKVCDRRCGFATDEYAEDDEDPILWLPTYRSKSTGDLYCEDHGYIDIDRLVNDFKQVTITLSHGDLNFLRAHLLTTALMSRMKLADPDYLSDMPPMRHDMMTRNNRLSSIAKQIDLVLDNSIMD